MKQSVVKSNVQIRNNTNEYFHIIQIEMCFGQFRIGHVPLLMC